MIEQLKKELEEFKKALFEGQNLSPELMEKARKEGRDVSGVSTTQLQKDTAAMIAELEEKVVANCVGCVYIFFILYL
jgi:hypothetical protein